MEYKEISATVLFRDNHLIALNKPAGIAIQPSWSAKENLEEHARQWLKKEMNKSGNVFLHAVHRLDRPASGIALFAKTGKALSRMNELMRSRAIRKTYRVMVSPPPRMKSGRLTDNLRHSRLRAVSAAEDNPAAKKAVLDYRTIGMCRNSAELEVALMTGRYHQIRFQFSAAGYPVVGDKKYGSTVSAGRDRICLHHYQMEFIHPVTKKNIRITAPLPEFWRGLN